MKLTKIKWKEEPGKDISSLPTEMEVPYGYNFKGGDITAYLLKQTGCHHDGFKVKSYFITVDPRHNIHKRFDTAEEAKEWAANHQDEFTEYYDAYVIGYEDCYNEYDELIEELWEENSPDKKVYEAKNKVVAVLEHYDFWPNNPVVNIFNNYEKACEYIKEEFEKSKKHLVEECGRKLNEEETRCWENAATLVTYLPPTGALNIVRWTIADMVDHRGE